MCRLYLNTFSTFIYGLIMLFTGLVLILTTVLVYWYYRWIYFNQYLKSIPGPTPFPIIGYSWKFPDTKAVATVPKTVAIEYGKIVKVMMGFNMGIFISDHKMLHTFLNLEHSLNKGDCVRFFRKWLGEGLLTSTGRKWQQQRKILTPSMHFNILKQFVNVFDEKSNILLNNLQEVIGQNVDIYPIINLCTLDIVCETIMGVCVNAQSDLESDFCRSLKHLCRMVSRRSTSLFQQIDLLYWFTKDYKTDLASIKCIYNFSRKIIASRRMKTKSEEGKQEDEFGKKQRAIFIDLLLKCEVDGQPLSNEEIQEEVVTFIGAGHETTTSALAFTLYCIAHNPDVQEKILEEQRNIFLNNSNRAVTYEDIMNMKYLESVIKESLRLYPPVPIFSRTLQQDTTCPVNNVVFKKDTTMHVIVHNIHHDPEVYQNPEKFDPERFADESILSKTPNAYIPFGSGPRNCIGRKFAMLEMKTVLSKIIRNYQILPVLDHKLDLCVEVTLKSANGIPIKIMKRVC